MKLIEEDSLYNIKYFIQQHLKNDHKNKIINKDSMKKEDFK